MSSSTYRTRSEARIVARNLQATDGWPRTIILNAANGTWTVISDHGRPPNAACVTGHHPEQTSQGWRR